MKLLETVKVRPHPIDTILTSQPSKVAPKRNLKDDYAVVLVEGTYA